MKICTKFHLKTYHDFSEIKLKIKRNYREHFESIYTKMRTWFVFACYYYYDFKQKTRNNLTSMMPDDIPESKTRFFKLRNFYGFATGKSSGDS